MATRDSSGATHGSTLYAIWAFGVTFAVFAVVNKVKSMRVAPESEEEGLEYRNSECPPILKTPLLRLPTRAGSRWRGPIVTKGSRMRRLDRIHRALPLIVGALTLAVVVLLIAWDVVPWIVSCKSAPTTARGASAGNDRPSLSCVSSGAAASADRVAKGNSSRACILMLVGQINSAGRPGNVVERCSHRPLRA